MDRNRILIVGGGIAGTTLAGLLQDSCDITLVEEGSEWRTIGYAVGIWKSGLKILEKLEFPNSFWSSTFPSSHGAIFGTRGQVLMKILLKLMANGDVTRAVTRDDLHKILISKLTNVRVRFNTTVYSLEQIGKIVRVVFNDNSIGEYDLVVGADGVYSKTRELVFGKKPLRSYQWVVWGGYVDREWEYFDGWHAISSSGEFLLSFPLNPKTNTFGLVCHKDRFKDEIVSKSQNLHRVFKKLDVVLHGLIDEISDSNKLFFSELYFVKMREWGRGRVVLAGDSRHARSPVSGMGTTLALEDAYVLADEIKRNDSIDVAVLKYAKRRQRRVSRILLMIDFLEWNIMVKSKAKGVIRDLLFPLIPDGAVIFLMKKIFQDVV